MGLIVVLAVVFAASIAALVWQQLEYRDNAEIYQRAERIAQMPPDTSTSDTGVSLDAGEDEEETLSI